MWPEDVARHAQDAISAAVSHSRPDWHIIAPIPTRHMIRDYIAEGYHVRPLSGDDFEFCVIIAMNRPERWFRVHFDAPTWDQNDNIGLPPWSA